MYKYCTLNPIVEGARATPGKGVPGDLIFESKGEHSFQRQKLNSLPRNSFMLPR